MATPGMPRIAPAPAAERGRVPEIRGWKKGAGWGWIWGPDDEVGSLNAMTDASRAKALSLVRRGEVFDLGLTYSRNSYKWPGHSPGEILTFRSPDGIDRMKDKDAPPAEANPGKVLWHSAAMFLSDNVATQIDGLAHITAGPTLLCNPSTGPSFRSPCWPPSATRKPRSSACARATATIRTCPARRSPARCCCATTCIWPCARRDRSKPRCRRCAPARPIPKASRSSCWPPTARRWRPKTSPAAKPSPAPTPISPTTSASSCRWPASPRSGRSRKTRSTCAPPAGSTSSTSSC